MCFVFFVLLCFAVVLCEFSWSKLRNQVLGADMLPSKKFVELIGVPESFILVDGSQFLYPMVLRCGASWDWTAVYFLLIPRGASKSLLTCWATGLERHQHSTDK